MAEDDDQPGGVARGGELDAADLGRGDDVAGDADDEQIAQPLVEDDLRRYARIGAAEQNRERLLAGGELVPPGRTGRRAVFARVGDEAPVAFSQPFECRQGSLHSAESDTGSA